MITGISQFLGSFVCNICGDKAYLYLKGANLEANIYRHNGEVIQLFNHQIKGGKKGEMPSEELIALIKSVAAPFLFASLKKDNTLRIFARDIIENQFLRPRIKLPSNYFLCLERKEYLDQLLLLLAEKQVVILLKDPSLPLKKVGKTELALQYFKGYADNYTYTFWIQAWSPWHLAKDLKKMASTLQIAVEEVPGWLRKNDSYLVVFDGVEDATLIEKYAQDIKGHILITSHMPIPLHDCLEVGLFTKEEAVSFLVSHSQGAEGDAEHVSQALGFVPSSLYRALETIETEGLKLSSYLNYCQTVLEKNALEAKSKSNLPARNKEFIGREAGLVALEESFSTNKPVVLAANAGMGGVGKTQIALQYAYRACLQYNLIWWIHSGSMEASYDDLAKKLKIYLTDEEKREKHAIIRKVNHFLEKAPGWLLIFDDAENEESLEELLPQSGGHILITSRNPVWNKTKTEVFGIEVFKREESIAFILKVTNLYGQEQAADQLAEVLQDLPLALAQAAAYIRETEISIEEYIQDFETMHKALWTREKPTNNYEYTVNVTWNISMEKIQAQEKEESVVPYPIALPLMQICSFFASNAIPRNTLLLQWLEMEHEKSKIDKNSCISDLNRTLSLLGKYSMVGIADQTIAIHALVQLVTRDTLTIEQKQTFLQRTGEVFMALANKYNPEDSPQTGFQAELLIPHAEMIVQQHDQYKCDKKSGEFLAILYYLKSSYRFFGKFYKSKDLAQQNLNLAKEMYPDLKDPVVAVLLNNLGEALSDLGEHEKALEYLMQSMALFIELQCTNSPNAIMTYTSISGTLRALGRYKEALDHAMISEKLAQKFKGEGYSGTAKVYECIGLIYRDLGEYKKAFEYFMEALRITKAMQSTGHPSLLNILNHIGLILIDLGGYQEALTHLMESLELRKKLQGVEHPCVATNLNNIGTALDHLGQYEKALTYKTEALELNKKLFGDEHEEVATSLNNLSVTLTHLDKHEEALKYQKEALLLFRKLRGEEHSSVATILNNIAESLSYSGNSMEALEYGIGALALRKKVLGPEHPDVAISLSNLGAILRDIRELDQALEYQMEALDIRKKTYGGCHPEVATSLNNVGVTFLSLGQHEKAIQYGKEALKIRKILFGPVHPDVVVSLDNLASTFKSLSLQEEALEYEVEAVAIKKKLWGANHPDLAILLNEVGVSYLAVGMCQDALRYQEEALEIFRKTLGNGDQIIAACINNITSARHLLASHQKDLEIEMKALETNKRFYGAVHVSVASNLAKISLLFLSLGEQKLALKHFKEAFKIVQTLEPNPDHPGVVTFKQNLENIEKKVLLKVKELVYKAQDLCKVGNQENAFLQYNEAFDLLLGMNDRNFHHLCNRFLQKEEEVRLKNGFLCSNIGLLLFDLGRFEDSLSIYQEAFEIFQKALGNEHPYVNECLRSRGMVLGKLKCYEQCLKDYVTGTGILNLFKDDHKLLTAIREQRLMKLFFGQDENEVDLVEVEIKIGSVQNFV